MKRTHKFNHGWSQQPDLVIDDRYQAELDQACARAEKAWKAAVRALDRAERLVKRRPEPATLLTRKEAEQLVAERLAELQHLHDLMRHSDGTTGSRHSGRGSVSNVTSTRRLP